MNRIPSETWKQIWVKTNWRTEQLDKKLIEFRFSAVKRGERGVAEGIGFLSAHSRIPDDLLSVQIVTDQPTGVGLERLQTEFVLSENYVSAIEPHPNQEIAHFRLIMA